MKRLTLIACVSLLLTVALGWFSVPGILGLSAVIGLSVWSWRRRDRLTPVASTLRWAHFLWDFFYDLAISNLLLGWDVLTPKDYHRVRLIEVPVSDLSDAQVALLIHRITLTPGTLTCDLLADRHTLLVHAMYGPDEGMAQSLRRPLDILRGSQE